MNLTGMWLAIAATFFWGTHSVLGRYLGDVIPAEIITTARLLIGALVLFLFLLFRGELKPQGALTSNLHSKGEFRSFFILSVIVAINLLLFHYGLKYTSANNAIVLESTAPIFVIMMTPIFFRKSICKKHLALSLIAFLGVVMVVFSNTTGELSLFGDSLELLAGFTWALFIIFSVKINANVSGIAQKLRNLMYVLFGSGIITLLLTLVTVNNLRIQSEWLLPLVYIGVFPTAFAYGFWYVAGTKINATMLGVIFNLSVVFTAVNSYVFLGETLNFMSILGIGLILSVITFISVSSDSKGDHTARLNPE